MTTTAPRRTKIEKEADRILELVQKKSWRMANLYKIIDKNKKIVRFKPNSAQQKFFLTRHTRNFVPKARKRGMSTAIVLDYFDDCLFANPDSPCHAAHVDFREDDAQEKLNIARLAWHEGPLDSDTAIADIWKGLHATNPLITDNKGELIWANGSKQQASTSFMGGTPNRLHLSEFGPLSAKFPERANSIVRGTLPAAPANSKIDIETTMEGGTFGQCANIFALAQEMEGKELSRLDWKLHFINWLDDPEYILPGQMPKDPETIKYFQDLWLSDGLVVPPDRQAWYETEKATQRGNMFTQFPTVVRECWYAGVGVNYFAQAGLMAMKDKIVPIQREIDYGDLTIQGWGRDDRSAIWKVNKLTGKPKESCVFRIWEHPIDGCRYVLFADCCVGKMAVGSEDGKRDAHSYGVIRDSYIRVADNQHFEPAIVAMCQPGDQCINDQFILNVIALGCYYGDCLTAPEVNNKDKIEERMMRLKVEVRPGRWEEVEGVKNMLRQGQLGADGTAAGYSAKTVQTWGHLTTEGTRRQILENMQKLTLEGNWNCVFENVLQEMSTFVVNNKGKAEAAPGVHDDNVLGPAIGLFYLPHATKYVGREELIVNEYRASWEAVRWERDGL